MLFSTNLLKQYISLDISAQDLMAMMTLHACEVEHVSERKIPTLVVIGYVNSITKHPNADTLTVCQVDCGSHGIYQICTAADNIKADIFVPVALPGCYLPAIDLTIGARQMRGEDSNGMICAKVELGIDEDAEQHGIWIMDEDFTDLTKTDLGTALSAKYLRLDNIMLDVDNKTINNRPDLTGLLGMAIEMKAIFTSPSFPLPDGEGGPSLAGVKSQERSPLQATKERSGEGLGGGKVKYQNITHILSEHFPARAMELLQHASKTSQNISVQTDKCSVYIALEIDNIAVRRSPLYDRLSMIDSGLSPKSNWIDFTNLFATTIGQPIHCFDADKISGTIVVRQAKDNEQFTDLQGTLHTLKEQDIVIADDKSILALAGVIGGLESGISDTTKRIVLELGHFDPVAVRRTSMRIGVRTDAVSRFEKTISPTLTLTAFSLLLDLLKQYKPMLGDYILQGSNYVVSDQIAGEAMNGKYIEFDARVCEKMIWGTAPLTPPMGGNTNGIQDKNHEIIAILESLGFSSLRNGGQGGTIRIPRRRGPDDMNIAEDLYEEVARLYGYNNIPALPTIDAVEYIPFAGIVQVNRTIEDVLVKNYKADQLQTYPRCDESFFDVFAYDRTQLVQLINTTAPELSYLRPSMIPNLLLAVQKNSKIYDQFSLFDTGQTRNKTELHSRYLNKQSFETTKLGMVSYKKELSDRKADTLLEVKAMLQGIVDALGLQGRLEYQATDFGYYHPKKQGDIYFSPYNSKTKDKNSSATPVSNNTTPIGMLAQLHPSVLETLKIETSAQVTVAELNLETLAKILSEQSYTFQTDGQYQTIQDQILNRDLCFVVDKTQAIGDIVTIVSGVSGVQQVDILDLYQGEHLPEGKKSITLTLTIVGDGGWTNDQINGVMNHAIEAVEAVGGKLR